MGDSPIIEPGSMFAVSIIVEKKVILHACFFYIYIRIGWKIASQGN